MRLYDDRRAPSPRRVRMFLAEKGLEVPLEPVDLASGANLRNEFLAVNAVGEVPVLELDDGSRITESLAICRYFEALHPEPNLLGRTAREQAEIEMWTLRLMFRFYVPTSQAFRHTHRYWAGRVRQVPEYGAVARETVLAEFERLEERLAAHEWIAAGRFTMADIVAYTTVDFARIVDVRIQPQQTSLKRWYDAISERPSARATAIK